MIKRTVHEFAAVATPNSGARTTSIAANSGFKVAIACQLRREEHDLQKTGHDRRHVTETRAEQSQEDADPKPVDRQQQEPRDDFHNVPINGNREEDEPDRNDDKIVREHDEVAADVAVGMDRERDRHLLDDALLAQKGLASFGNDAGKCLPDDQSEAQIGQVSGDLDVKQPPIDHPDRDDHHQGAYGQPEWPQHRAAIAQLDVLHRQRCPHPALAETIGEIAPGKRGPAGRGRPSRRTVVLCLGKRHRHHSSRLYRLLIHARHRPLSALGSPGSGRSGLHHHLCLPVTELSTFGQELRYSIASRVMSSCPNRAARPSLGVMPYRPAPRGSENSAIAIGG